MNPIKDFFAKKVKKLRENSKGKGHRLCDEPSHPRNSEHSKASNSYLPSVRCQPSESAQRAGAAAISRVEQKHQTPVNWSVAATKAQARKELELEHSAKMKHSPIKIVEDSCPALSVSGVYFSCPLIGPDILPLTEIRAKIKDFLYEQLEQERGLTACLIIHTCNKNKEKVTNCVDTVARYLTNIIDNPTEMKFRKIRVKNKVFQEKVAGVEGAVEFLSAAGFSQQTIEEGEKKEDYLVFQEEDFDLENLQMLKEALLSAEPIVPVLDRNLKVLRPLQVAGEVCLPNDFFQLTAAEIQREQEAKTEAVELGKVLRTKAMRERDEIKEIHKYRFSLIRIRFDEIVLQGTFHVNEKLSAVKVFIEENIAFPEREYHLSVPGNDKLTEDNQSLLDLKLAPAAILIFHQMKDKLDEKFLKEDTLLLLEDEKR